MPSKFCRLPAAILIEVKGIEGVVGGGRKRGEWENRR